MPPFTPPRRARVWAAVCVMGFALHGAPPVRADEPASASPAPTALSGRIVDPAGHGVAGCEVRIPEMARTALTGADGTFRIEGLPAGQYTFTVQRFGYAPLVRRITAPETTALDLALEPTPFTVPAVEVTATRAPLPPNQSPLPTSALYGDALRLNTSVSLAHAIEQLPGVHTLSTGEQVGKPVVRGLQGARVLVLDDGRRLEDYSWSDEDGPSIDARNVERVEVVRGPASVLYGSDALGGVVNAIPAPLPEAAGPGGFWRGQVEAFGGSNNLEVGSGLRLEGASGAVGWRTHVIGRFASDLHTPDGELAHTGFGAFNGDGAIGVRGTRGNANLRFIHYGGEYKLLENEGPGTGFGGTSLDEGPERKLLDDRVQIGGNYFTHGMRLEARGQWQRHSLIEVADAPGSAPGSGQESEQFNLLLNTGTLDLIAHHGTGRWRGSAGVWGFTQTNDSRGPIPLVPDATGTAGALFAFEEVDLGRFSLLAGARNDWVRLQADANALLGNPDETRTDLAGSGDVGIVFRATEHLSLAANAGRAWRAPTLFERYANGPRLGEARYEIGRADLSPENGTGTDLQARWQDRRVRAEVAGFWNGMRNYIFVTPTGETRDSLAVYRYQQADATLAGGEAGLEAEIVPGLTARTVVDAVWANNDELDEPLPLTPAPRGTVGVAKRWEHLTWAESCTAGADVEMQAKQTRLSTFDTATAAYALLNLQAGARGHWLGRDMEVDLQVHNATNTSYRDFLSRYKTFALDPGRNFLVRFATGI